jgi:hypothetical protein
MNEFERALQRERMETGRKRCQYGAYAVVYYTPRLYTDRGWEKHPRRVRVSRGLGSDRVQKDVTKTAWNRLLRSYRALIIRAVGQGAAGPGNSALEVTAHHVIEFLD